MGSGISAKVSGVDRLFLDPDLESSGIDYSNDVWSFGAILYTLVTGGELKDNQTEFFDFSEPVWKNEISQELEFMLRECLYTD